MKRLAYLMAYIFLFCGFSCRQDAKVPSNSEHSDSSYLSESTIHVERIDTNGLVILFPSFSQIDLRCGNLPDSSEEKVVLFAEAAYTRTPLEREFRHCKIAGDHVSKGIRYKGYNCCRNTGAFVYYAGKWKFLYNDYSAEMDSAAKYGGAAFAQEMMIHNSDIKRTARGDRNNNVFRALCELNNRLCVIESLEDIRFGDFKSSLKEIGVSEAIYLDMGFGWNHAWYRANDKSIVELHPKVHDFCTNWITFYR